MSIDKQIDQSAINEAWQAVEESTKNFHDAKRLMEEAAHDLRLSVKEWTALKIKQIDNSPVLEVR